MMTRTCLVRTSLLTVALLAALPLAVYAQTPVTMNIFSKVVDEQPTGCFASPPWVFDFAGFTGDINTSSIAYNFGAPWTTYPSFGQTLFAATYVNGGDCNRTSNVCLGVKLNHNEKTLSLDTRGTNGPRTVKLDFSAPCTTCGTVIKSLEFGKTLDIPMLVSVFLDSPFTGMGICSSTACPEAQPAFVKLWFDDPPPRSDRLVTWRVDWPYVRVLRMSANTWYVLADGCDGSQVASLYKRHNDQKRVSISFQGKYLMPFFLSAVK